MRVTDFTLDASDISGNAEGIGYLLGQRPYYEYVSGKKTENQLGITYNGVFPDNLFEKAAVKVANTQVVITDEQILKSNGKMKVRFKNLTGKFYRTNSGEYVLSCRADGLEVIS